MVRLIILVGLSTVVVLYSSAVVAQTPSGPTDNELYAAYCNGALSYEIEELMSADKQLSREEIEEDYRRKNPSSTLSDGDLRDRAKLLFEKEKRESNDLKASRADLERRRRRFAAYLLSTGVLTDHKRSTAALGLTIAMNQGRDDWRLCSVAGLRCLGIDPNSGMMSPRSDEAELERLDRITGCVNATSCPKVSRCGEPDALPF